MNWYHHEREIIRLHKREHVHRETKLSLHHELPTRDSRFFRSFDRLLAALGARMVTWGCRLQARYQTITIKNYGLASFPNGRAPQESC